MKLRKILSVHGATSEYIYNKWPVICQFSSIGSLGAKPESWLIGEFLKSFTTLSLSGPVLASSSLKLIFPCVENVRQSLEGYRAGGSLPYSIKTHSKQEYLTKYLHHWKSDDKGRTHASPHIKTYFRVSPEMTKIMFVLLTSSNLSKAAWGCLEKSSSQLFIRSYELGVLFIPKILVCFLIYFCLNITFYFFFFFCSQIILSLIHHLF